MIDEKKLIDTLSDMGVPNLTWNKEYSDGYINAANVLLGKVLQHELDINYWDVEKYYER